MDEKELVDFSFFFNVEFIQIILSKKVPRRLQLVGTQPRKKGLGVHCALWPDHLSQKEILTFRSGQNRSITQQQRSIQPPRWMILNRKTSLNRELFQQLLQISPILLVILWEPGKANTVAVNYEILMNGNLKDEWRQEPEVAHYGSCENGRSHSKSQSIYNLSLCYWTILQIFAIIDHRDHRQDAGGSSPKHYTVHSTLYVHSLNFRL